MSITTIHPLFESPISLDAVRTERAGKVAAMARILLDWQCWADEDDCRMVLRHAGYSHFEIEALLGDARQVAVQHAVAMAVALA